MQNKKKLRILLITNTPPIPTWGGYMIFHRHFCERNDFEIAVITDHVQILDYKVNYPFLLVSKSKIWTRLSKTRFHKWVHTWGHLFGYVTLPKGVKRFSADFKPDAVLTVAATWNWMAIMAKDVASQLNVPLIGSFMDWWTYNTIRGGWADKLIEAKFYRYYRECDLALCISEGMMRALGAHKNSLVLYPLGSVNLNNQKHNEVQHQGRSEFKVTFAGNLGDWYGKMVEQLISVEAKGIEFEIFGSNPGWSAEFDAIVRDRGIYHGLISFEDLQQAMDRQDALLLFMGFAKDCEQVERTSFKTKFLDYISFQRPILLWGPDYCTAVEVARRFDSAEICTSPQPEDFARTILKLKDDVGRQKQLVENASKMYEHEFHPDKIHERFRSSVETLLNSTR
jgi:glycosyltransferase involved in cell wall biosynthesis